MQPCKVVLGIGNQITDFSGSVEVFSHIADKHLSAPCSGSSDQQVTKSATEISIVRGLERKTCFFSLFICLGLTKNIIDIRQRSLNIPDSPAYGASALLSVKHPLEGAHILELFCCGHSSEKGIGKLFNP